MNKNAILLSPPANFAVIQLPLRNYPGIVVQGDTMHSILIQLRNITDLMSSGNLDEASEELEDIINTLSPPLYNYEEICKNNGIKLPYSKVIKLT